MRLNEMTDDETREQHGLPVSSSILPQAAKNVAGADRLSTGLTESPNQHQQSSCFSPKQLYVITALITIAFVAYILLTEGILNNRRPSIATPSPSAQRT